MAKQSIFNFNGADVEPIDGYNFVSQKLISGNAGQTLIAQQESDFQNTGPNLSYNVGNYYENIDVAQDETAGQVYFSGGVVTGSATNAFDDNTATGIGLTGNGNGFVGVDFGAGNEKIITKWRLYSQGTNDQLLENVELLGSNDNISYTSLDSITSFAQSTWTDYNTFINATPYRYYKIINLGANAGAGWGYLKEAELIGGFLAPTTGNTTDAKMPLTFSQQFDPSTIVIKDKNGTEVSTGTLNCIEVINGTPANGGVLVDYITFKARPNTTPTTNIQVRVQPVGLQTIKSVQMSALATNLEMTDSTITQSVAGTDAFKVLSDGNTEVNGLKNSVKVISDADYTAMNTDGLIIFDNMTSNRILTLPNVSEYYNATNSTGQILTIIKKDSSTNIVTISGGHNINGKTSRELTPQWDNIKLQSDGTQWLQVEGGARINGFDDYTTDGASLGKTGANVPTLNTFRDSLKLFQFGIGDEGWASIHIKHDYVAGTPIFFHAHWAVNDVAPTGAVNWEISYSIAQGFGAQAFPAETVLNLEQTTNGQYVHEITEDAVGITNSNIETDSIILFHIKRVASTGIELSSDPFLIKIDIHFNSDSRMTNEKIRPFTKV